MQLQGGAVTGFLEIHVLPEFRKAYDSGYVDP